MLYEVKVSPSWKVSQHRTPPPGSKSSQLDFMSGFEDDNSVPCDELASQNMISCPEEIEDSQASDYSIVLRKNEKKRAFQPDRNKESLEPWR